MKVIYTINEMKRFVKDQQAAKKTIGFVPTMGYLHEGHLSLIGHARRENETVVVSIFVNPLQFNDPNDLAGYPRSATHDTDMCMAYGVDVLFMPSPQEMYPKVMGITMTLTQRMGVLCDRTRPGHFGGVLTVLTKLFHLVEPTQVYFGMKDAQQVAIVDLLIEDLNFHTVLRRIPTVRESDGLAKSSRNVNLNESERQDAPLIYQALTGAKALIDNGERDQQKILSHVNTVINQSPHATIDYVELLSYPQLEEISTLTGQVILACAVKFERARLIDNVIIDLPSKSHK